MFDLTDLSGDSIRHWVFLALLVGVMLWRKLSKQDEKLTESAFRFSNPVPSGKSMLALALGLAVVMASDEVYAYYKVSKVWEANPFVKLIIDDQPKRFSGIETFVKMAANDSYLSKEQLAELRKLMAEISNEPLGKYLPVTSDAAAMQYSRSVLNILKELEREHPEACYGWLYEGNNDVFSITTSDQTISYKLALAEIVKQAIANPQPPADQKEVKKVAKNIFIKLKDEMSNNPFALEPNKANTTEEKGKACSFTVRYIEETNALPVKQASILTRGASSLN